MIWVLRRELYKNLAASGCTDPGPWCFAFREYRPGELVFGCAVLMRDLLLNLVPTFIAGDGAWQSLLLSYAGLGHAAAALRVARFGGGGAAPTTTETKASTVKYEVKVRPKRGAEVKVTFERSALEDQKDGLTNTIVLNLDAPFCFSLRLVFL